MLKKISVRGASVLDGLSLEFGRVNLLMGDHVDDEKTEILRMVQQIHADHTHIKPIWKGDGTEIVVSFETDQGAGSMILRRAHKKAWFTEVIRSGHEGLLNRLSTRMGLLGPLCSRTMLDFGHIHFHKNTNSWTEEAERICGRPTYEMSEPQLFLAYLYSVLESKVVLINGGLDLVYLREVQPYLNLLVEEEDRQVFVCSNSQPVIDCLGPYGILHIERSEGQITSRKPATSTTGLSWGEIYARGWE